MSLDLLKAKIKNDLPVSSVIGHYLAIKKSGTSLLALCPFHDDSKPSMQINDSKKMFKCFVCNTGGDSIAFVMKYRHLNFIEALEEISHNNDINFESYMPEKSLDPKLSLAYKMLDMACFSYHQNAISGANNAFNEFAKERNLSNEAIDGYRIGVSTDENPISNWINEIKNPEEQNTTMILALDIGLIKVAHEGITDTFKNRIMFPIMSPDNIVIGFISKAVARPAGSIILMEDRRPKYINSYDSFVFNKRNVLYGFHLAKKAIKEKDAVILVEGPMDQIALYNSGFHNTVAVMGIALGATCLERLIGITKNIYLALDSDQAGYAAMVRINRQLAEKGIVAKFLEFSPQKDPDEFIQVQGARALQTKIDSAVTALDVLLDKLIPERLPEVVDRKLDILQKVFVVISPLGLSLEATERLIITAKRLGLKSGPEHILKTYEQYLTDKNE